MLTLTVCTHVLTLRRALDTLPQKLQSVGVCNTTVMDGVCNSATATVMGGGCKQAANTRYSPAIYSLVLVR